MRIIAVHDIITTNIIQNKLKQYITVFSLYFQLCQNNITLKSYKTLQKWKHNWTLNIMFST